MELVLQMFQGNLLFGLLGALIGVVIFLMGFYRGRKFGIDEGVKFTFNQMFEDGLLAEDDDGNLCAGPELK